MSSPALTRGTKKALRTLAQMAASGALTVAVNTLAGGLSPAIQSLVATAWMFLVTFLQNSLEGAGKIPVLLPSPSLIPMVTATGAVLAPVVGAVDAVADTAGAVTGDLTDVTGDVVGEVTGQLGNIVGGIHNKSEQGGAGMVALVIIGFLVLVIVGGFTVCDWTINDKSEPGDQHLLGRAELVSHRDDRDGGDGYDGGQQDQRRCQGDGCRGSFSPGPFDRSPVDIHDNQVCISPDCSSHKDDKKGNTP